MELTIKKILKCWMDHFDILKELLKPIANFDTHYCFTSLTYNMYIVQ